MKDYSQVQEVLVDQNIPLDDQEVIKNFLRAFSYTKRQQLIGIFLGYPDKINLFVGLIKKKTDFSKNPTEELSAEILDIENSEIKKLISELK